MRHPVGESSAGSAAPTNQFDTPTEIPGLMTRQSSMAHVPSSCSVRAGKNSISRPLASGNNGASSCSTVSGPANDSIVASWSSSGAPVRAASNNAVQVSATAVAGSSSVDGAVGSEVVVDDVVEGEVVDDDSSTTGAASSRSTTSPPPEQAAADNPTARTANDQRLIRLPSPDVPVPRPSRGVPARPFSPPRRRSDVSNRRR